MKRKAKAKTKDIGFPEQLKVGYRTYAIAPMPAQAILDDRLAGQHFPHANKIYVTPNVPQREQINTLVHELLHAILSSHGVDFPDEERVVLSLANGLCTLLRDNPGLATWLGQGLED